MYWNLIWNSPGFVPFGINLTHFGSKSGHPDSDTNDLAEHGARYTRTKLMIDCQWNKHTVWDRSSFMRKLEITPCQTGGVCRASIWPNFLEIGFNLINLGILSDQFKSIFNSYPKRTEHWTEMFSDCQICPFLWQFGNLNLVVLVSLHQSIWLDFHLFYKM